MKIMPSSRRRADSAMLTMLPPARRRPDFVTFHWLGFWLAASGLGAANRAAIAEPLARTQQEVRTAVERHNAFIKAPEEWNAKRAEMCETPFTFYRATAHLFYEDIAKGRLGIPPAWDKRTDLRTWISGDFHLRNVGFEEAGDGELFLELNDFDEACEAPFYWDVIRWLTSIHLVKSTGQPQPEDENHFKGFVLKDDEADGLAEKFLKHYRKTILSNVSSNVIAALTAAQLEHPTNGGKPEEGKDFVREHLSPSADKRQKQLDKFWKKNTANSKKELRSPPDDPNRFRSIQSDGKEELNAHWADYLRSLDPEFLKRVGTGYFKGVGAGNFDDHNSAFRLGSGLGSRGVRKINVLVEGPTGSPDDNIILEIKEVRPPAAVEAGALRDWRPAASEGERASRAQRAMTARHDPNEGWFNTASGSFHVTRASPYSWGAKLEDFKKQKELEGFVECAAIVLANAHCRTNPRFAQAAARAFKEDFPDMERVLLKLARAYAVQVVGDHRLFCVE